MIKFTPIRFICRKKDIVDKYRSEDESSISRKISKMNMHSLGKKSARISLKFLSSIGIDSLVRIGGVGFMLCSVPRKIPKQREGD